MLVEARLESPVAAVLNNGGGHARSSHDGDGGEGDGNERAMMGSNGHTGHASHVVGGAAAGALVVVL